METQNEIQWATEYFGKQVKEVIKNEMMGLTDILFVDGSKCYNTVYGQSILIERPECVDIVEYILEKGFTGWGYMPIVERHLKYGNITSDEAKKIIRILD